MLRELRALRLLEGQAHVVTLLDAFPQGSHLALVLEYMPSDLEQVGTYVLHLLLEVCLCTCVSTSVRAYVHQSGSTTIPLPPRTHNHHQTSPPPSPSSTKRRR